MRAFSLFSRMVRNPGAVLPNRIRRQFPKSSCLATSEVSESKNSENSSSEDEQYLLSLFNQKAPIAKLMGMTLSFEIDGTAVVKLPYNQSLSQAEHVSGQVICIVHWEHK